MLNPEMAGKGLMFSEARYAVLLERNIFKLNGDPSPMIRWIQALVPTLQQLPS